MRACSFFRQHGAGELYIEELDHRPHEECRENRTDACDGRNCAECTAGNQKNDTARNDADYIGCDTAVLERRDFPFACQRNCDCVIGGNTKIRRYVKRRADAQNHNAHHQTDDAHDHRRIDEQGLEKRIGKFRDIAQQEKVDEGGDADLAAINDETEGEQDQVDDHIQRAEWDRDERVQTAHERLEGIDAKCRDLENADADRADNDAGKRHQDTLGFLIHHNNSFFAQEWCAGKTSVIISPAEKNDNHFV